MLGCCSSLGFGCAYGNDAWFGYFGSIVVYFKYIELNHVAVCDKVVRFAHIHAFAHVFPFDILLRSMMKISMHWRHFPYVVVLFFVVECSLMHVEANQGVYI